MFLYIFFIYSTIQYLFFEINNDENKKKQKLGELLFNMLKTKVFAIVIKCV